MDWELSNGQKTYESYCSAADKPLIIGDIKIQCYVLEDETRVLSQRGMTAGIGLNPDAGFRMPHFLASRTIKPFVSNELMPALKYPILFQNPSGGGHVYGYPATILPEICKVILNTRQAGALNKQQKTLANRCEALHKILDKFLRNDQAKWAKRREAA